jgi:hypothetical protein
MTRRGIARSSNAAGHPYLGKQVGRAQRQRSKITRGMTGVLALQDLERLLSKQAVPTTKGKTKTTKKRQATHA